MGLLDALNSGYGGQGGLLSYLQSPLYPSPLNQPQDVPQPQYDPMGNYTGVTPQAASPFGPIPQMSQPSPAQFQPPSAFTTGAAALPGMAPGVVPTPQQPSSPAPQAPVNQVQDANVGGYSMPRFGSVADYTPQPGPTDVSAQSRQPQMQAPQQAPQQEQALPPALGGIGSAFGRAFNPDGLIARLTGNDSRSQSQQNLKAQYEALVPLVGQQKAMLAVLNPEAGKTILAQALEKKQYGFQKLDSDTVLRTDPLTGKAEVAYGGGEDAKSIPGPDGKPIAIPPGLDAAARKVFMNEVARNNAKAAGGELTEAQAKSTLYASKMELAEKTLKPLEGQGTSIVGKITSGVPLGNYAQSADYQKYKQASSNFITALLRQESGAAISKSEFERYDKEYMPQPGDSSEVLAQKTEARRIAIEGMKKGAGPGYKSPTAAALPSGWSVQVR
jgi:hypothetical protein